MFGMFAGGWKLDGNPPGRPGCWPLCIPGGGATPGAAIPGGPVTDQLALTVGVRKVPIPEEDPMPGGAFCPGKPMAGGRPKGALPEENISKAFRWNMYFQWAPASAET